MAEGITSIPGIRVGHYTDTEHATGCTVVLCDTPAVGGVDVRGSAPGTTGTDALRPTALVSEVHAVLLSGGSAFGLEAVAGVMRYLEERGIGLKFGGALIPIVPAAILFDLGVVTPLVRPGAREGYAACQNASSGVQEGSVGAGTGATVGKLLGIERAIKGGIGTASLDLGQGVLVGALMAVNAVGGVHDPDTGQVVAGPRDPTGRGMLDSMALLASPDFVPRPGVPLHNTTIGVVATSARLTREQANKLAAVAHDGIAMAVRPAHTMSDGDTIFALATGAAPGPGDSMGMTRLCAAAALCVARAILRGVRKATSIGGIPAVSELN